MDVGEGQTVRLQLQRSVYTAGSVVVSWTTVSHQTGARDYSPHSGSITFTNTQHTAEISLAVADDDDNENLEVSAPSFQLVFGTGSHHISLLIIFFFFLSVFFFFWATIFKNNPPGHENIGD